MGDTLKKTRVRRIALQI